MTIAADRRQGGDHAVRFCIHDEELVDSACEYLTTGLRNGETVLAVATAGHRDVLMAALAAGGLDPDGARRSGRLAFMEAERLLAQFMVAGHPDAAAFEAHVGTAVRRLTGLRREIRVFGEMVSLLWEAGDPKAALELEDLWNDLRAETPFALLCGYRCRGVVDPAELARICARHDTIAGDLPTPSRREVAVQLAARRFAGTVLGARTARRFTADLLTSRGLGRIAEDAAIIVGELAANAVTHARSHFTVTLSSLGTAVCIAVGDDSALPPAVRECQGLEARGRGLRIVASLASEWGARSEGTGKVVWAELRL